MSSQKDWKSTKEIFTVLNKTCQYVVMRNYENMNSDSIFMDGHEDIDMLCDDYKKVVDVLDARPRRYYDNKVQYYILLNGNKLKIDLRHVGDRYYDENWQKDILNRRRMYDFGFYVMSEEDYYYSLIYHAVLQKKKLSDDYEIKLSEMGSNIGIEGSNETEFLDILFQMMKKNGYFYTFPEDSTVPNRFELVPKEYCKGKKAWFMRKVRHFPIRVFSYLLNRRH